MHTIDILVEKIELSSYKDQLLYNSNDIKVILFSSGKAYEYSCDTHKIRPFNSVIWYPLKKSFDDFIFYLDDKIKSIKMNFYDYSRFNDIAFNVNNGRIEIDLDSIRFEIEYDRNIKFSFNRFFEFISKIYNLNECMLKKIIYTQQDLF